MARHQAFLNSTAVFFCLLIVIFSMGVLAGCGDEGSSRIECIAQDPAAELKGWQLDESNTGLCGSGIYQEKLPLYEPPEDEIEYGTWYVPADTTIMEKRIEMGGVVLDAGNITFERCWFLPRSVGRGMPLIHGSGAQPSIIRDCDIDGRAIAMNDDGTNPACGAFGVNSANIQIVRCNIQGFGSGVGLSGDYPVTLERTYIHDLVQGEWVLGSGESHQDGVTMRGFSGTEAIIRNNHILTNPVTERATGPVFFQATWTDSFLDNITVQGNLLAGYGYSLVLERNNGGYGTNMRAFDNRFDPYNGWLAYVEHGPGWARWQDNYMNDPSLADNRGDAVADPMTQDDATLAEPTGLQATADSGGSVTLSWTDNSDSETGFKVMRSTDGTVFDSLTITAVDSVSYTDTGLTAGNTYYYRIAAVSNDGMSEYSNTAELAAQ